MKSVKQRDYPRDDVRECDMQRDHFQNCYIFVARRACRPDGRRASHTAFSSRCSSR